MIRAKQLESLKVGEWLADDSTRGGGRFTARRLPGGAVAFYFRYTLPEGGRDLLKIGEWSERGDGTFLLTLEQARAKAASLRSRYLAGDRNLRAALEEDLVKVERAAEAAKLAERQEEEARRRRAELSLGGLLVAYVGVLDGAGKSSSSSVEKALYRHIRDAFPRIWGLPVDEVDEDSVSPLLDRLTEAGKLREAAKLRSYLRAAFSAALKARKAGGAIPLRRFNIRVNPLRDIPTIDGAVGARDRALTLDELRAYWRRLEALEEPYGALLRFHLATGGQRIEQLSRATTRDLDGDNVILADPKGRREKPRRHLVPLIPEAVDAMSAMANPRVGPFLFTVTNGEVGAGYDVLGRWVRSVAAEMVAAGEAAAPFTPGDIRRTVETRLAAAGVPGEIRAQLQSHGLSGVQQRHYNVHDYAAEKREVLARLLRLASGVVPKVAEAGAPRVYAVASNAKTKTPRTVLSSVDTTTGSKNAQHLLARSETPAAVRAPLAITLSKGDSNCDADLKIPSGESVSINRDIVMATPGGVPVVDADTVEPNESIGDRVGPVTKAIAAGFTHAESSGAATDPLARAGLKMVQKSERRGGGTTTLRNTDDRTVPVKTRVWQQTQPRRPYGDEGERFDESLQ